MEVYKVEGRGIRARGPGMSKGPQAERHRLLKAARMVGGPGHAEQRYGEREQRERLEPTCEGWGSGWGCTWEPGVGRQH